MGNLIKLSLTNQSTGVTDCRERIICKGTDEKMREFVLSNHAL